MIAARSLMSWSASMMIGRRSGAGSPVGTGVGLASDDAKQPVTTSASPMTVARARPRPISRVVPR
jgi:hypothetical protein